MMKMATASIFNSDRLNNWFHLWVLLITQNITEFESGWQCWRIDIDNCTHNSIYIFEMIIAISLFEHGWLHMDCICVKQWRIYSHYSWGHYTSMFSQIIHSAQSQTDRQTDRDANTHTQTERWTVAWSWTDKHTNRHTNKQTHMDKQTDEQMRSTDKQTYRHTDSHKRCDENTYFAPT